MTKKALISKVETLQELERQMDELKEMADAIKGEIKGELTKKNATVVEVGKYIIRWTPVSSSRFDTKSFKESHPKLYKQFTMEVPSRKFTISK